jgi:23S rRNA U2552 (ribose-2'-O)-methylase RlmE/FtsJ
MKKDIKCIITKERIDGLLDEFELSNTDDLDNVIPLLNEFKYFILINQDIHTDLFDNPITIDTNNSSFHVIISDLIYNVNGLFDYDPISQTIRIYCFLHYKSMINFLDIIYH